MNIDTFLINRVEVIDDEGRALTLRPTHITLSVQDDGRTLKVFATGTASVRERTKLQDEMDKRRDER